MSGNREYKSDVFSMLMKEPGNALALYNALNGSSYSDADEIEIKTLDRGISLTVRNDAAFVLDSNLSVYEHQSTVCPNMPVRSLIYFSMIIGKVVKKYNIYGKARVLFPTPKFAVFYNGSEDQPEQYDLKLSDSFVNKEDEPQLELKCRVYNINKGRNKALLDACTWLRDYYAQYDCDDDKLELAINMAINQCIDEGVLADFLKKNRSEVVKVTQLDYTFDRQIELERNDARIEGYTEGRNAGLEDGRAEGRAEGRTEGLANGEKKLATLIQKLIKAGLADKIGIVASDVKVREEYYEKFGMNLSA